jgi:drug/metabolite transporter (DMT)-like permease
VNNTNTFFTAILGFFILGERISLAMGFCMFGCFGGIVLLNIYQPKTKEQ